MVAQRISLQAGQRTLGMQPSVTRRSSGRTTAADVEEIAVDIEEAEGAVVAEDEDSCSVRSFVHNMQPGF
jgi:hypothetical protein